jgi:methyltransferase (TIGR00027 family)
MIDSAASRTALMVCAYRARASERLQPICRDPWARPLAGPEGDVLADAFLERFPHMELWIALRTAYLDEQVDFWSRSGQLAQVVILGAGFDTRAARLGRGGVTFFEVDHPATQAEKRLRLAGLAGYPAEAPRFAACDFEKGEDVIDRLAAAGFDRGAPALVLWEGVVPYLSEAAVRATARRLASGLDARSVLVFDILGKRMAEAQTRRAQDQQMLDYVGGLGEPIRFGTNDILPLLVDEGYRDVRVTSYDELALRYTGSYERDREFRFQSVVVASPSRMALVP